jgi:hypothetical protein
MTDFIDFILEEIIDNKLWILVLISIGPFLVFPALIVIFMESINIYLLLEDIQDPEYVYNYGHIEPLKPWPRE